MPHINLLPWREELRKQRQKEFGIMAGIGVVVAAAIVFAMHMQVQAWIDYQKSRNKLLDKEIAKLEERIQEIESLEKEKQNLIDRMRIVEQLQTSRPEVVHLFDELVMALPEGVYFESLVQKGNVITLKGKAQSNARVSSLMRNLDKSKWLERPDLKLIKTGGKGQDQQIKLSNFELTIRQKQQKVPGEGDES